MVKCLFLACAGALLLAVPTASAADRTAGAVIYDGIVTQVGANSAAGDDLWLTLPELKQATKFELKPEGVCRGELCFPLPENQKNRFVSETGNVTQFNLTAFAQLLKQPVAYDKKHLVWYFGPRPEAQNGHVKTLEAPNFTLPDLDGKMHSLSDFRGKKVLLITWGSW
jgi:hypothetical protein